ncbi:MAG: LamB/YcsF family protein [Acidothermus sp.]|nr:LamB/YcsF family protein [Acidothermus sp.]
MTDASTAKPRIDLNADVGESFGAYTLGSDDELLGIVTSASIACGFHAGDPSVMHRTVETACRAGVVVGAHVGYPDLRGFGRRAMAVDPRDLYCDVLYQIGALDAIARACGTTVRYVKPHGALYHAAAADPAIARAVATAIRDFGAGCPVLTGPGSALVEVGEETGIRVVIEGFPDRAYTAAGTLVPRSHPAALIEDPAEAAARAVRMATDGKVVAVDGSVVDVHAETLCIHGDAPDAPARARAVRQALQAACVEIVAFV